MKKALLGKKLGMTQIFDEQGKVIPVTVIEAGPCTVVQIKTKDADGYEAVQLGFGEVKANKVIKPKAGHFKKANVEPKKHLREFRLEEISYNVGDELKADVFTEGEFVDITGTTKGKGFQGVIKRHGQSRGPMGHGSMYHRRPGSMGPTSTPGRVFKGKKLPGHMGDETVTIQNLEIVEVNTVDNYILVSGNIPGAKNSLVLIKTAVKNSRKEDPKELISYVEETVVDEVVTEEVNTEEVATTTPAEETTKEENPEESN